MYRLLLLLYPSSFRAEYGEEMSGLRANGNRLPDASRSPCCGWSRLGMRFERARGALRRVGQDVRYASCSIRRAPGFAATVVLVAALGIGATTAVFTVADYVLVRPLPYLHSERLVRMWEARPGYLQMELSPPNYLDWKAVATSFEVMAAYAPWSTSMVGQGEPIQVEGANLAADLLLCSALRLPWADGLLSTRNAAPHPGRDPWLRIVGVSIRRSDGRDRRKDSAGRRPAHDHRHHAARVFVPAAQGAGLAAVALPSRRPGEPQQLSERHRAAQAGCQPGTGAAGDAADFRSAGDAISEGE